MSISYSGSDSVARYAAFRRGFFSTAFERKEYMEGYIAEEVARAMIAKDPAIKPLFDAEIAGQPGLATPEAKREWFYRRSSAWDERVNLLPVYRMDALPNHP